MSAVDQCQAVAVHDRLSPFLPLLRRGDGDTQLETLLDQRVNGVAIAGQEPPTAWIRAVLLGVQLQDLGRIECRIDRDADEWNRLTGKLRLKILHGLRDPRARERASGKDEGGDPDAVRQIGFGDWPARSLGQAEGTKGEGVITQLFTGWNRLRI